MGEFLWGGITEGPAGPFGDKSPLSASWPLEERAQRKPGVSTMLHSALPLGLSHERGQLAEIVLARF